MTVDTEVGAKGGNKDIGDVLTRPDCVSEKVRKRGEGFVPLTGYELLPRPKNVGVKDTKESYFGWICLALPMFARKMEICAFAQRATDRATCRRTRFAPNDPRQWRPRGIQPVSPAMCSVIHRCGVRFLCLSFCDIIYIMYSK